MISARTLITAVITFFVTVLLTPRINSLEEAVDKPTHEYWVEVQAMNRCLIDGAERFEQRYAEYRTHLDLPAERRPGFAGFDMGSAKVIAIRSVIPSPCNPDFSNKKVPDSLLVLATQYVKAYDRMRPTVQAMERWLVVQIQPDAAQREQLDQTLKPQLQSARELVVPFRQSFEYTQLLVREQQLASIERRNGHDQHWHTLRFMLLSRKIINALDAMADGQPLTPKELLTMSQPLATAWQEADMFMQGMTRLRSANGGQPLWNQISLSGKNWLDDLEGLQKHWTSGADASELNLDLAAARASYDTLRLRYNEAEAHQY